MVPRLTVTPYLRWVGALGGDVLGHDHHREVSAIEHIGLPASRW